MAKRMIRGTPSTVSCAERLAGLGGQHQGEVLVGAQLLGGGDDGAHEQVLERVGAVDVVAQDGEELLQLADPQRLEQDVLAAGEQPVDASPGTRRTSAAMSSMVTLANPHRSQQRLVGVEDAVLGVGAPAMVRQ